MITINQSIDVNAYYFTGGEHLRSFPKIIQHKNHRYTFVNGIQYLVKQGSSAIKLFDMTDGKTTYRLRREGNVWTLVGTK